jgi:hypothetical protein
MMQSMNRPAKLQRSYQMKSLRKLDTAKNRGVTRRYTMWEGVFFVAKNSAGDWWSVFVIDCSAKVA